MKWHKAYLGDEACIDSKDGVIAVVKVEKHAWLLAAAPDLLKVAKDALEFVRSINPGYENGDWVEELKTAIAKAEGPK